MFVCWNRGTYRILSTGDAVDILCMVVYVGSSSCCCVGDRALLLFRYVRVDAVIMLMMAVIIGLTLLLELKWIGALSLSFWSQGGYDDRLSSGLLSLWLGGVPLHSFDYQ